MGDSGRLHYVAATLLGQTLTQYCTAGSSESREGAHIVTQNIPQCEILLYHNGAPSPPLPPACLSDQ